ncbi:ABC transporter ATP-binding protein [Amycolatopsis sp. A1MSW2902]
MIAEADRRIGGRSGLRGQVAGYVVVALAEGVCFGTLVPILREVFAGRVAAAVPWVIAAAAAAAVGAVAYLITDSRSRMVGVERFAGGLLSRIGAHVTRMPLGWFTRARSGRLAEVVTGSALSVTILPGLVVWRLVAVIVTPLVMLLVVLFVDWRMALAMAAVVPVGLVAYRGVQRTVRPEFHAQSNVDEELSSRTIEFAQAQPVLRAAGQTEEGWEQLEKAMRDSRAATVSNLSRTARPMHRYLAVVELGFALIVAVGVLLATGGELDAANLAAILVLAVRFVEPFSSLAGFGEGVERTRVALQSIGGILDVAPLPEPDSPRVPRGTAIDLDDVRFGYSERPVLDGLNLTVLAGSVTALVGPSGAGKTTVTRLIARFWDVDGGAVRIGGEDVRALGTEAVLSRIAMVFQDVYLFDDTIEENIRVGRPDATLEEVHAAARSARVDEIVERLPGGWASRVGEGGARLSGGERQRVSIARALLKEAPIVLLDEVTAALDGESEAAVVEAIRELSRNRTVVVIAHRLSTIVGADQIAFLDGGRVIEAGSHDELLDRGGRYSAMWMERAQAEGWQIRAGA